MADGKRGRGALGAFCVFAASLLPACSGCQVDIERSEETQANGVFHGLLVSGTEPDGAFVVAQHERAPGDDEAVLVSLADGEQRTCSLGKAFFYHTQAPRPGLPGEEPHVDKRPARILTIEGEPGAKSGDLRIFDASCTERIHVPSVEAPIWPTQKLWPIYDDQFLLEAYAARTTSGEVVTIDPWAGSVRTISESASFWTYLNDKFWLIEGGSLVARDRDGKTLQTASAGVTEFAVRYPGEEVAYVDAKGLWVLKLGDPEPIAIPTTATPCKPQYFGSNPPRLAYRDDCATGVLAVRNLATGDTRVFSSGVTSVRPHNNSWYFFEREEPGKKRELWAVPGPDEPVLVGTNPMPDMGIDPNGDGFLFVLDYDGATGTLGKWTLAGGFVPRLEGYTKAGGRTSGITSALTDVENDVGTFFVLRDDTLAEVLRVPRVRRNTPWVSQQAPALAYLHDWDDTLGAGTFTAWIPANGQQIDVDTGVSEFGELLWPEPGVVYAVRTPERAGLWTAYPDF